MSYRYSNRDIQSAIDALNFRAGFPQGTKLWEQVDGRQVSKVGFYHSWNDGGGMRLVQTVNDRGGHRTVFKEYCKTKREFYNVIWAYIAGRDDASTTEIR